jgi:hypothetical protein
VARSDIKYMSFTTGEVSLALSSRLRTPRYEARVTRHRPEDFLVLFDFPPQRELALRAGLVRVRGVDFDVLPWTENDHGRESTWWYRVRVSIENLPIHAWNAQVARQILGDDCLFDRLDSATFRQEATDIFFCWAWMWNPDFLHRTKRMTIFPPGAGQAPDQGGCYSRIGLCLHHQGGSLSTSSFTSTASRTGAHSASARPPLTRLTQWNTRRSLTSRTGCRGWWTAAVRYRVHPAAALQCHTSHDAMMEEMMMMAGDQGGSPAASWTEAGSPSTSSAALLLGLAEGGRGSARVPLRHTGTGEPMAM